MRIIFTLCTLFALVVTDDAANCPIKFQKLGQLTGQNHTMCQYTKTGTGKVQNYQIKGIVEKHNRLRTNPYQGITARAMCKVYWDENIANIAQYYASTCPTGHDELRDVPGYNIAIEQNLAWNESVWDDVIQLWFNTGRFFRHEKHIDNTQLHPGDYKPYSRIVQDTMCRFGCGFSQCGSTKTYVCNYASGDLKYKYPFKGGSGCQDCPNNCFNWRLCECKGKVCYNGGTLNPGTCTCTCRSLYKGDMCQKIKCRRNDASTCPSNAENPLFCKRYKNTRKCPKLCKTCENFIKPPKAKLITGYDT